MDYTVSSVHSIVNRPEAFRVTVSIDGDFEINGSTISAVHLTGSGRDYFRFTFLKDGKEVAFLPDSTSDTGITQLVDGQTSLAHGVTVSFAQDLLLEIGRKFDLSAKNRSKTRWAKVFASIIRAFSRKPKKGTQALDNVTWVVDFDEGQTEELVKEGLDVVHALVCTHMGLE